MEPSLLFQVITYFNIYYLVIYNLTEFALYIFKGTNLPYPTGYAVCDVMIFVLAALLELLRLDLGRKGNLTEHQLSVVACLLLTIPCTLSAVYILLWQTYVLRIEIILSSIQFVFHGLEIIYCIVLAIGFTKRSKLNLS